MNQFERIFEIRNKKSYSSQEKQKEFFEIKEINYKSRKHLIK